MNKVSVIIPVYNVENYLTDCIDSVLNQTYKNIEIILVNDGSSDNSHKICEEYKEKYSSIIYINQENKGVSVARNRGLKSATGDYVYFLDSDDTINDTFIETSIALAVEENSDIVLVSQNLFNRKNIVNVDLYAVSTSELIISKKFLDKYPDITFPENLKNYEDALFSHMLICLTYKISINKSAVYEYRKRTGQVSTKVHLDKNLSIGLIEKWLEILENFYNKYNLWNFRKYYLGLIVAEICTYYWNTVGLTNEEKSFFFDTIHNFVKKHNLCNFKTYNFTISNFMADKFIASKSCSEYEISLFLIKIFKIFKKIRQGFAK